MNDLIVLAPVLIPLFFVFLGFWADKEVPVMSRKESDAYRLVVAASFLFGFTFAIILFVIR